MVVDGGKAWKLEREVASLQGCGSRAQAPPTAPVSQNGYINKTKIGAADHRHATSVAVVRKARGRVQEKKSYQAVGSCQEVQETREGA